jgi:hypothetical protein
MDGVQFASVRAPVLAWTFDAIDAEGDVRARVDKNFTGFAMEVTLCAECVPKLRSADRFRRKLLRTASEPQFSRGLLSICVALRLSLFGAIAPRLHPPR